MDKVFDVAWTGDVAVVGAGIVGLATAREILSRRPSLRLVVLEKEPAIARHQTGHNSGVIHSGIYYAPGSLKARTCVAGAAELRRYCDARGIPYRTCGKLIVAADEDEVPRLEDLYRRGLANGVPGLRIVEPSELRELEPHVAGVRAILSPSTGVVDYGQVADAYAADIRALGGEIRTGHEVVGMARRVTGCRLETTGGPVEARAVITCAGLYADRVAAMTGAPRAPQVVPFRGDYYVLRPERRGLVTRNIYPVPDPRFPFLGVHVTPRLDGTVWLGPNAVPAFAREGYRFTAASGRDLADMLGYPGFRRFARLHWRTGLAEMARDLSRARFLDALRRFIPKLEPADLLPGPAGVRAQALGPDGELVDDFAIDRADGVLHVRNAPSPAATASLRIGAMVADAFFPMLD